MYALFVRYGFTLYNVTINDTSLEHSVLWPSNTKSRINVLWFSDSVLLSFESRFTSFTCFCGDVTRSYIKHGTKGTK